MKFPVVLVAGCAGLVAALAFPQRPLARWESERRAKERARYGYRNVVSGRIVDAKGRPIPGLRVGARFRMHQTGMPGEGDAYTDADGRYEIRALGDNDFTVGVEVNGTPYLFPEPQGANLRTATRLTRNFVLQEGPLVTVRVRDAETGTPIEGLAVRADRLGMGGPPVGATGRDGVFSWRANTLDLTIQLGDSGAPDPKGWGAAPGYAFYKQVKLSSPTSFRWETKAYREPFAQKDATFRGVVLDAAGVPVTGATVKFLQNNERKSATTDASGRFAIQGKRILDLGHDHLDRIVLFADAGDRSATMRPTPEETWAPMRIVVRRDAFAQATGRVVDEKGRPASGVPIVRYERFIEGSGLSEIVGATDANGRFAIERLRPGGDYSLSLGGGDWGSIRIPADSYHEPYLRPVVAGERRSLGKFVVPRARNVVEGTMVAPDGALVKGAVTLSLQGAHTSLTAYPDAGGKFRFDRVPEESLTLRAFASRDGFTRTGADSPDLLLAQKVEAGDRRVRLIVKWRPAQP